MKLLPNKFTILFRFAISGTLAAAIYYVLTWFAVRQFGWRLQIAAFTGYLFAVPVAYGLHRIFTYRSRGRLVPESRRFFASAVMGLALSSLLPTVMIRVGLSLAAALALTCVLVPVANYLLLSCWVFSRTERYG